MKMTQFACFHARGLGRSYLQLCHRIGLHKKSGKFNGKRLYQSLFFNKIAGLQPVTSLKKRFWHSCFPINFTKYFYCWLLSQVSFSVYSGF